MAFATNPENYRQLDELFAQVRLEADIPRHGLPHIISSSEEVFELESAVTLGEPPEEEKLDATRMLQGLAQVLRKPSPLAAPPASTAPNAAPAAPANEAMVTDAVPPPDEMPFPDVDAAGADDAAEAAPADGDADAMQDPQIEVRTAMAASPRGHSVRCADRTSSSAAAAVPAAARPTWRRWS